MQFHCIARKTRTNPQATREFYFIERTAFRTQHSFLLAQLKTNTPVK